MNNEAIPLNYEPIPVNPESFKMIFIVLNSTPVIFALILVALAPTGFSPEESGSITTILVPLLYASGIIQLLLAHFIFLPKARNVEGPQRFSNFIVAFTMADSVGVYGLMIGLLHLFVYTGIVDWITVFPFIAISFLYMLIININDVFPWIKTLKTSDQSQEFSE